LLEAAGARMDTANGNSVPHVLSRVNELMKRGGLILTALARRAGMDHSHICRIFNEHKNIELSTFDTLVSALGAHDELRRVERYYTSQVFQLALAAGAESETAASGEGPTRPHLHAVPNNDAGGARS